MTPQYRKCAKEWYAFFRTEYLPLFVIDTCSASPLLRSGVRFKVRKVANGFGMAVSSLIVGILVFDILIFHMKII